MKLSSQNLKFLRDSNFKLFFKSCLIGFIIIILYTDVQIILKNKYETTGQTYYILFALFISFCYLKYF